MPFKSKGYRSNRKCKYCDKPAKINYFGILRRHKGYLRTCGSKGCFKQQYKDSVVNAKKAFSSKGIEISCDHCGGRFLKTTTTQKWCAKCVPDDKARSIMQRYSLSKQEYLGLIKKVSGICPICKRNNASVVDHCHKTNKVRGIICQHCNMALNLVENQEALQRAIIYLKGEL